MSDRLDLAIILAAGMGTRLRPMTDRMPKCLIPVKGRPILYWQLKNLEVLGVKEVLLVIGYRRKMVEDFLKGWKGKVRVQVLVNEDYETTNNIYSLYLAKDKLCAKPFLLLNGDVYCDPEIFRRVLEDKRPSLVPFDSNFFDPEELKVLIQKGKVVKILPKKTGKGHCNGSTIGMFKIGAKASTAMFQELDKMMAHDSQRRHWFESVLNEVFEKVCFRPRDIVGFKWVEIDTKEDLEKAQGFCFDGGG